MQRNYACVRAKKNMHPEIWAQVKLRQVPSHIMCTTCFEDSDNTCECDIASRIVARQTVRCKTHQWEELKSDPTIKLCVVCCYIFLHFDKPIKDATGSPFIVECTPDEWKEMCQRNKELQREPAEWTLENLRQDVVAWKFVKGTEFTTTIRHDNWPCNGEIHGDLYADRRGLLMIAKDAGISPLSIIVCCLAALLVLYFFLVYPFASHSGPGLKGPVGVSGPTGVTGTRITLPTDPTYTRTMGGTISGPALTMPSGVHIIPSHDSPSVAPKRPSQIEQHNERVKQYTCAKLSNLTGEKLDCNPLTTDDMLEEIDVIQDAYNSSEWGMKWYNISMVQNRTISKACRHLATILNATEFRMDIPRGRCSFADPERWVKAPILSSAQVLSLMYLARVDIPPLYDAMAWVLLCSKLYWQSDGLFSHEYRFYQPLLQQLDEGCTARSLSFYLLYAV